MKKQVETQPITMLRVTVSHNPRDPSPAISAAMADEGFEGYTCLQLVRELALSDDADQRARFVALVEKYDNKLEDGKEEDPEGLVALARSRREVELQPIMLRAQHGPAETRNHGLILGERRFMAAAYNHAKHGDDAVINADVRKVTVAKGLDMAWEENRRRRNPQPMEVANYFHSRWEAVKGTKNEETGKNWTMKDVSRTLGEDYQEFRRSEALTYLPEADQKRLDAGKLGKVAAQEKALKLKRGAKAGDELPDKKEKRRRVETLKQVEQRFDSYRQGPDDEPAENGKRAAYLQALADVMGITYKMALRESTRRLKAAAREEAAAAKAAA